jgi:hypothetical protein
MELGYVLGPVELDAVEVLADGGGGQTVPERLTAFVGFYYGVDPLDAFEVLGPLVAPG